jgi:hypothetical protein
VISIFKCNRLDLAEYLSQKAPNTIIQFDEIDSFAELVLKKEQVALIWPDRPSSNYSLPHALVVPDEEIDDIHAWVITYFRQFRPFTAHCRILPQSVVNPISLSKTFNMPHEFYTVAIGLIVSEGVVSSISIPDWNRLHFSAFTRTLSYLYAESIIKYCNKDSNKNILHKMYNNWLSIKEITNKPRLSIDPLQIRQVWDLVLATYKLQNFSNVISDSDFIIIDALNDIKSTGSISNKMWLELTRNCSNITPVIKMMNGPLEERVKATEFAISELSKLSQSEYRLSAFIIGYLTSQISQGSLDFFPVILPVMAALKESFLWYGVCAGMSKKSNVDFYGNSLGLLVRRELERKVTFFDRPDCDIAFAELDILLKSKENTALPVQSVINGILKVELYPHISTIIRWPTTVAGDTIRKENTPNQQISLFSENEELRKDVLDLLKQIEVGNERLNEIRIMVEKKFGEKSTKKRWSTKYQ